MRVVELRGPTNPVRIKDDGSVEPISSKLKELLEADGCKVIDCRREMSFTNSLRKDETATKQFTPG